MEKSLRELLLKDLCARLPYGGMMYNTITKQDIPIQYFACMTDCKPYLRPMSSMTENERNSVENWNWNIGGKDTENALIYFDWLNKHHFDYRGLIEKGLALEAPEGMYKDE